MLWASQLENIIASGNRLIKVADLARFLERVLEDVVQGSKGIDPPWITGMSGIEWQPAIFDGFFNIRYIIGTVELWLMVDFAIDYKLAIDAITGNRDMKMRSLKLDAAEWAIAKELRDTLRASFRIFHRLSSFQLIFSSDI